MSGTISPAALKRRLVDLDGELALLDVRERGVYGRGHLLFATSAPLSRLEIDAPRMVPRRATPIVLCDDDDGLAARAAEVLERFGYGEVSVLDGGVPAWRDAGYELFGGVYVPSKAFGEFVEATYDTPRVSAVELESLRADNTAMVILDSRPAAEYRRMNIPGGVNVPGAELIHRIHDIAPDPETLVVVNCAGRTRSIIGAQSLINAGVPNRVVALENGTMGWTLAGLELEHGQDRVPPPPSEAARGWARDAAARLARRFDVPSIDRDTLVRWRDEAVTRTLYLCDVRSPEEYLAGHLPGAIGAPGGQLVQASDSYIPVLGARVVLVDDDGARATMTASWLIQMGRGDIHVLAGGLGEDGLESGPAPREVLGLDVPVHGFEIGAATLAGLLPGRDVAIIDLADSRRYKAGHIPGAWFVIRSRLEANLAKLPPAPAYVATSPDGALARLAAGEISRIVREPVKVLAGGTDAWAATGMPLPQGPEHMADGPDDVYLLPYDHPPERIEQAMRDYLSWETSLVPQIARDGTARFRAYPA